MELGISMFGDIRLEGSEDSQSASQRLQELMEEIKLMDETGLDFFGIGEHHRKEYAVSMPEIILAAAATITKNIRLGSAVSVLSSTDPVRLFQAFATIDGLSTGRAEVVVGRGSFTESFPLFGNDLADYDALFEEKLDLLLKINSLEAVSWSGKFRPALQNQEIFPRPDKPLPIWVAVGGTPESVLRAAKFGLPLIVAIIGGSPLQFKPFFEYYKQLFVQYGHDENTIQTGVHMHAFFGENDKEIADSYYPNYAAQMNRIGRQRGWQPYQRSQYEFGRTKQGALIIGDPQKAIEKILQVHEMFGITRFSAHMDVGAPSHALLMKSIEIFGNIIAPAVRKALQ